MNYLLAKELKDAGFPQKEFSLRQPFSGEWPGDVPPAKYPYNPTLEELIEACGEDFFALMRTDEGWMAQASLFNGTSKNFVGHLPGQTPSEAVARLWLALQKS